VASGVIHYHLADAEETILNKCHAGAILDYVLFRKNNYRMTAKALKRSVVPFLLQF
jgi:CBS domain-containing protein